MHAPGDQDYLIEGFMEGIRKANGQVVGGLVEDDEFAGLQVSVLWLYL